MERWLADQTRVFLYAAALGLLLGLIYDVIGCAGRAAGARRAGRAAGDLFFCAVGLALFLLFMLTVGRGEFRSYIPLGAGLGLVFYFLLPARPVRRGLTAAFRVAGRGLRALGRLALAAFSYPRGN